MSPPLDCDSAIDMRNTNEAIPKMNLKKKDFFSNNIMKEIGNMSSRKAANSLGSDPIPRK